jgi:Zn-dependent protease
VGRIHLGTLFGTTVDIDFSFLFIAALFVMNDMPQPGMPYALLWVPVLFISVLFHELAHASANGVLGFGPSHVLLTGMGGVTVNQRDAKPWQDLIVSLAGPAANFVLSAIVLAGLSTLGYLRRDPFFASFLPLLATANLFWGVFNLMPVGPLDGQNALRSFLRLFLRERIAFVIAVWVSIVIGAALAVFGVFTRWIFLSLLMLWYVWMSWQQWQFFRSHNRTDG